MGEVKEMYRARTVVPELTPNLYLDHVLKLRRGPDGVELDPTDCMGSGDGYLHFSIPATVAEEAAWWAVGSEHAVPAMLSIQLLRPATVRGGTLVGRGNVLRLGRGVMYAEGCVTQEMRIITKVSVTFVYFVKQLRA